MKARITSQIGLLDKYGFDPSRLKHYLNSITVEGEKVDQIRWKLTGLEGKCTELYLKQYITLFPKYLQPEKRKKYRAKAPLNNLLNLGYEILKGERARLFFIQRS